ncbi:related to kinesin light chain [Serendipita indica DSM 11827]|uniref:Related to kinesin light chain n=1 Tax=Serendipita indica (strain DSM 11827) TaxID=1109443 RepID=G4U0Z3_SERID|nr:related to kinesin light chain [Serendipita indica DSM 11827]
MKLCAFLNPSHIPFALFEQSSSSHFTAKTVLESYPPQQSDRIFISDLEEILGRTWDEITFRMIVESASRASFINVSTDGLFYTVHPALQGYIKDSFGEEEIMKYTRTAAQLLLGAMRSFESTTAQRWQLLPHINCIPRSVQSENVAHALAFHDFYDSLGDWKASKELLESALSKALAARGQRHGSSTWLMDRLACTLSNLGQLDEAEKMQRDVLALQLEIFGPRHLDTTNAMNNLANTLHQRGQLDEAEKMEREVLALRLEILGQRHPDTIGAMHNLASTLQRRGKTIRIQPTQ